MSSPNNLNNLNKNNQPAQQLLDVEKLPSDINSNQQQQQQQQLTSALVTVNVNCDDDDGVADSDNANGIFLDSVNNVVQPDNVMVVNDSTTIVNNNGNNNGDNDGDEDDDYDTSSESDDCVSVIEFKCSPAGVGDVEPSIKIDNKDNKIAVSVDNVGSVGGDGGGSVDGSEETSINLMVSTISELKISIDDVVSNDDGATATTTTTTTTATSNAKALVCVPAPPVGVDGVGGGSAAIVEMVKKDEEEEGAVGGWTATDVIGACAPMQLSEYERIVEQFKRQCSVFERRRGHERTPIEHLIHMVRMRKCLAELFEREQYALVHHGEKDNLNYRCVICMRTIMEVSFPESCMHAYCLKCLYHYGKMTDRCFECNEKFTSIVYDIYWNFKEPDHSIYCVVQRDQLKWDEFQETLFERQLLFRPRIDNDEYIHYNFPSDRPPIDDDDDTDFIEMF